MNSKINKNTIQIVLYSFFMGLILGLALLIFFQSNLDSYKEQQSNTSPVKDSYSLPVNKAAPAVVNIYTEMLISKPRRTFPFSNRFNSIFSQSKSRVESSLGSGVIFSSDGYILTNQHVIGDHNLGIIVELSDGRRQEAKIIGIDKGTDLAVLKIESNDVVYPSIEIADSDNLKIGDVVLAIGNPYGLGQSVSLGIISATGREFNNPYSDYIQTDASINRGNSGGALIDTSGRLVGINTLIRSTSGGSEGIGLAIPSVTVLSIINDLIQFGEVQRGWLGFGIDKKSLAINNVLLVGYVHPEGPAKRANLKEGDILLEINQEVSSYALLFKEFARSKPGTLIKFKILRGQKIINIELMTSSIKS